jgi:hypothetical protein
MTDQQLQRFIAEKCPKLVSFTGILLKCLRELELYNEVLSIITQTDKEAAK